MRPSAKTFHKLFLFFFFIFLANITYAQSRNAHIDSLNKVLWETPDLDLALKLEKVIQKEAKELRYYPGILDCAIKITIKLQAAGRYGVALKKLEEIEGLLEKYGIDDDKFSVYFSKAMVYWQIGFYNEANTFYDRAMIYALKEPNIDDRYHRIGEVFLGKAMNFKSSKSAPSDTIEYYLKKSLSVKKQIREDSRFRRGLVNPAHYLCLFYITEKKLDSAKKYLDFALGFKLDSEGNDDFRIMERNYFQGMFYVASGEYQKSLPLLEKAMEYARTLKANYRVRDIAEQLSKAFGGISNHQEEKKWLKIYTKANDSIGMVEKQTTNEALEYLKPTIAKVQKNNSHTGRLWTVLMVSVILVIGIVVFFLRKSKNKNADHMALTEKVRILSENMHAPEKRTEELKRLTEMAMSNDPVFFTRYNEFDPMFRKNLLKIEPSVTAADLEFCAYIKLNFDTKEIARYCKLSVRAVESKKSRLRKKLGISSSTDLNLWMSQL